MRRMCGDAELPARKRGVRVWMPTQNWVPGAGLSFGAIRVDQLLHRELVSFETR